MQNFDSLPPIKTPLSIIYEQPKAPKPPSSVKAAAASSPRQAVDVLDWPDRRTEVFAELLGMTPKDLNEYHSRKDWAPKPRR